MTNRHNTMARWVSADRKPETPPIETQDPGHPPATPTTVYVVVLSGVTIICVLFGVMLTLTTDWPKVLVVIITFPLIFISWNISSIILSGNLKPVLAYRAYDRHDERAYNLEMERLANERFRDALPPALMDPDKAVALRWVQTLYGDDGTVDPGMVYSNGQLVHAAPWGGRSDNPDGAIILHWVRRTGIILTDERNPRLDVINYPSLSEVRKALR